jgi:hypothetical protein
MQTTTTLTLKDTKTGTSARGAWALSIFAAGDGRDYTTLDGALASKVKANDGALFVVDYEERPPKAGKEQHGPSYNLTGVELAPEGAKASPVVAGKSGEFRSSAQIIRTSALEAAVSAFSVVPLDPVSDLEGVLSLAAVYERFITEGLEEEPEA